MGTTEKTGVKGVEYNITLTTKQEVDEMLAVYEKQNPTKYAIKKARGEFDALYEKVKGYVPPKAVEPEPTEEEVEAIEQKEERKAEKEENKEAEGKRKKK